MENIEALNLQKRIAIAEACGWEFKKVPSEPYQSAGTFIYFNGAKRGFCFESDSPRMVEIRFNQFGVPDYLNDLNAMHEAEKVIRNLPETIQGDATRKRYQAELEKASSRTWGDRIYFATASQRAEAFLKTIQGTKSGVDAETPKEIKIEN